MRDLRLVLPAIALATVFPVEFASAAGALLAHRAIYDLDLGDATDRSGVTGIAGRIVYEFTGSACEGYSTNYRFVSQMQMREAERLNDYQIATYEEADGESFDFAIKFFVDDTLDTESRGTAVANPDGVAVRRQKPETSTVELPATRFPTQHMVELINKAKEGENFYETTIFDGSDKADKIMTTTVIIGKPTKPDEKDPELAAMKTMEKDTYWPVSIAYFDMASGEEVPSYAINFKLYENGFTRDLVMDYGEFSIKAQLVGLEVLESRATCEAR